MSVVHFPGLVGMESSISSQTENLSGINNEFPKIRQLMNGILQLANVVKDFLSSLIPRTSTRFSIVFERAGYRHAE